MKPYFIAFLLWSLHSTLVSALELVPIAEQFVAAVTKSNDEEVNKLYAEGSTKQNAIVAFAEVAPMIESGKLKISAVEKELIIGDLGISLTRLEFTEPAKIGYKPMFFVKIDGVWKIFPRATQKDIDILKEQRSPDERIHLQLFNEWVSLTQESLEE